DNLPIVENAATVDGMRHRYCDFADLLRSALVHRAGILHAFRFQPVARFVDRDHLRGKALRQRDGVVDMIEMPVRDADGVHALDLVSFRIRGIAVGPGIHQDDLARRELELERAVAQPGDAHAYRVAHAWG